MGRHPPQDPIPLAQTPMTSLPDITDTEQWVIETTLRERYGRDLAFRLADADRRLHPSDRELNRCPVILWRSDDGCTLHLLRERRTQVSLPVFL